MSHKIFLFLITLEDRNIEETPIYTVQYTTYISYFSHDSTWDSLNMSIIYGNVNVVGW